MKETQNRKKSLYPPFDQLGNSLETEELQVLIHKLNYNEIALALKGAGEAVYNAFMRSISDRVMQQIIVDLAHNSPINDIVKAQRQIIETAKGLSETGAIRQLPFH